MKNINVLNSIFIVVFVTSIGLMTGEFFQLPSLVKIPTLVSTLSTVYMLFNLASYVIILHGLYLLLSRKRVCVNYKK